ncbi:MAG TPA: CsgG/HfaB family protein [Thermodesulfobacteriota bacterium]|nr:CsgG/HfaB family protein [Thermodesulfobacteriota bacterium]
MARAIGKAIGAMVGCAAAAALAACASTEAGPVSEAPYTGPRARIAVADFVDKASGGGGLPLPFDLGPMMAMAGGEAYAGGPGRGMADMLVTALFQTRRFIVLEREQLEAVRREQQLAPAQRTPGVSPELLQRADLLLTGAITGFDPGVSGGQGGLVSSIPIVGSLAGSRRTAYVAMDLRLIDTRTAEIVAVTTVSGTASHYSGSASVVGGALGGSLSGYRKTPMETAIRQALQKAVEFIIAETPPHYYRYGPGGAAVEEAPVPVAPAGRRPR